MKRYTPSLLSEATGLLLIGATVEVLLAGTATRATLYQSNNAAGATVSNPAPNGAAFYVPDGRYDLVARKGIRTTTAADVDLYDLAENNRRLEAVENGEPGALGSLRADLSTDASGVAGLPEGYGLDDILRRERPIENVIPKSVLANILAGGKVNATPYFDKLADALTAEDDRSGIITVPNATWYFNWTMRPAITVRGRDKYNTVFRPFGPGHTVRGPATSPLVRTGFEDCTIEGNLTDPTNDSLNLEPQNGFYDTIKLSRCVIRDGGRNSLRTVGINSTNKFIQALVIDDCEIRDSATGHAWHCAGTVIESRMHGGYVTNPRNVSGSAAALFLGYVGAEGGSKPGKISFWGTSFANQFAHSVNNGGVIGAKDGAGKDNACGIEIEAANMVNFFNCSWEFCSPFVRTADFVFAKGVNVWGGGSAVQRGADYGFVFRHNDHSVIAGFEFTANLAVAVKLEGGMRGTRMPIMFSNTFLDGTTTILDPGLTFYQQVTPPNDTYPYSIYDYGRDVIVVQPNNADPRLAYIRAENGSLTRFVSGQRITLKTLGGATLGLLQGNIRLAPGSLASLSGPRMLSFVWSDDEQLFIEEARTGPGLVTGLNSGSSAAQIVAALQAAGIAA